MTQKRVSFPNADHTKLPRLQQKTPIGVSKNLLSGAMAGACAKTVIAPLDRTKINFQSTNTRFSMRAFFDFLKESYKLRGFFGLWRGNSATLCRILPYSAIQFASHEEYKYLLGLNSSTEKLTYVPLRRFLAGAFAGFTSVTATYPLDLARARMAVTDAKTYKNLFHALSCIYRHESLSALYRGYIPTAVGNIPYAGTAFLTFGSLRSLIQERKNKTILHPLETLGCGAIAGLCGQTVSYPLDIVRRRMQNAAVTGHPEYTQSIIKTLVIVYQLEGIIHGWYKGLSLNWIKGPVASGISFSVFHLLSNFLHKI